MSVLAELLPTNAQGRISDGQQSITWQTLFAQAKSLKNPVTIWPADNSIESLINLVAVISADKLAVPYNPRFSASQLSAIQQTNNFGETFPKDLVTGIFTSGSTGTPKLVGHSLNNHIANAKRAHQINPTLASSRWHMSLPIFHIGGLAVFFRSLLAGCDLWLHGRVDNASFLRGESITHASCVATQLQRLAQQPLNDLALQTLLVGGGPVPSNLLTLPLPIRYTYGMSELSSQACTQGSDGKMHWLCDYQFDEQDQLLMRGDTLFAGYIEGNQLQHPKPWFTSTCSTNKWFASHDTGFFDDAWLTITGRIDNQFISGGENIQPEAIERLLVNHQHIQQAVVVPVADAEYGQRPFAFVQTRLSSDDIAAYCQQHLPSFMRPVAFAPLHYEQLKPNRKQLTQEAEALIHG
ncbi:AMP-binding protein [Salinibius halmophilus]|uniref:AMP-binding protein n=1 Tax=Salinibius halmophilus TaxID=1853216 RepID=UPI000E676583|nr:AMP-binding protein [Salinibius halmophilus]